MRAFRSTDQGVSFLAEAGGTRVFHAGDLNFWHWRAESTPAEVAEARRAFDRAIAEIEGERVKIVHSLTSMGCPAGPMIQESIHEAVAALPGVEQVEVELTFDPPWTPDRMSDDAKFILGFG